MLLNPGQIVKVGDAYTVIGNVAVGSLAPIPFGRPQEGRSSGWVKLERETVEGHPFCSCCGRTSELQVHHLEPFHLAPERELDPTNLIVVCRWCHWLVCHLCDWKAYNPLAVQDCARLADKIKHRWYDNPHRKKAHEQPDPAPGG